MDCFTCEVADGRRVTPGGLVVRDELVIANHRDSDLDPLGAPRAWPAWFVVSPRRHVRRSFELTGDERRELLDRVAQVDRALTELVGARRCMIASLGWHVDDHLHVHVVPTWTDPTLGWQNFNHPGPDVGIAPAQLATRVAELLSR